MPSTSESLGKQVLLVEDDREQSALLTGFLTSRNYRVSQAYTGAQALSVEASGDRPDFILLDLNLPDADGVSLCPQLKARFPQAFVVMLTARKEEMDRIIGLEVGADDYVVKPYSLRELETRMRAILRRHPPRSTAAETAEPEDRWVRGNFSLDKGTCTVSFDGTTIPLTAQELRVLSWLVRHPGRIFSRDRIIEACWDEDIHVTDRVVDAMVARIRKKLKKSFGRPFIFTKHGMGYGWRLEN